MELLNTKSCRIGGKQRAGAGKILRGRRAKWISQDGKDWTLIGVRMDSESTNLNADVSSGKDVTGAPFVDHNGFAPESDIEYQPREEDSIYPQIQKITDELLKDEESCTFKMIVATLDIEVKDTGEKTASGTGYQVDVLCVPQEDGGSTSGYTIPVNFYETGTRVQGTVSVSNKKPTFTPANGDT